MGRVSGQSAANLCAHQHFYHSLWLVGSQSQQESTQQAKFEAPSVHSLRQTFAGPDHVLVHVRAIEPAIVPCPEHRKVQVREDLRFER